MNIYEKKPLEMVSSHNLGFGLLGNFIIHKIMELTIPTAKIMSFCS